MPIAFGTVRKDRPRRETPDWLVLVYALTVMLIVRTVYGVMSRRAYAASRGAMKRALRYSEEVLEPPMDPAPVRVRARR